MVMDTVFELCLKFLKDLIAINTVNPPGNEGLAARYIQETLKNYGIDCQQILITGNRLNVISNCYGGNGPAVLLTGHLDVVPIGDGWNSDPFQAEEHDGRIYGRGACDMKGGIAAMMAAAIWAIETKEVIRPFRLGFVADEEIYGTGTRELLQSLPLGLLKYVVIGEPTENEIHIAHRGAIRFRFCVHGKACHAGAPTEGINALENAAKVIEAIQRVQKQIELRRHEVLPPPTICCTMANAGVKDNIVPSDCVLIVDCRPGVGDSAEMFEIAIRKELEAIGGLQEGATLTSETYIDVPAGCVAKESPIVEWAKDSYRNCFGKEPVITSFPACCDLSQFTSFGIPAILYGPGAIAQAHTDNEFVEIDQLKRALNFYCSCLRA